MSGYQDLITEGVKLKNRYKSLFRKSGKRIRGELLYHNQSFLKDLKRPDFKFVGERIYHLLEEIEKSRRLYLAEITRCSRKFKEIKKLKSCPGIGPIHAAQIVSQVIDPKRFSSKYKYYSYCGLVRHKRDSGERSYGSKKIWGNRVLKCVYKMAGHAAVRGNSGLRKYYDYLRSKGVSDNKAYNAVCRKIAAITLSLWRNNTEYDDNIISGGLID